MDAAESIPTHEDMVSETVLMEHWSISQKKIRVLRPEGCGPTWPRALANAVALANLLPPVPIKNTAPDEPEALTVVSTARGTDGRHFPNKHIIEALRRNGERVLVRVVDSAKYRPTLRLTGEPMTVKAVKGKDGNWWVLVGREPRYPAQW